MTGRTVAVVLLGLLSISLFAVAATRPTAPAAVAAAPVSDDDAATEANEAERQLVRAYYADRANSPQPRERALATLLIGAEDAWPPRHLVLDGAAAAAPDDVLVQWLHAHAKETEGDSCRRAGPDLAAAAELFRLEPDNAAVHLLRLSRAWHDGDALAIDQALVSMAAADRFDSHLLALSQAQIELFARHPVPHSGEYLQPGAPADTQFVDAALALSQAALVVPDFGVLSKACNAAAASADAGLHRYAACADATRLMLRSPSMLERLIGYGVLRKTGLMTQEEMAAAARARWILQQIGRLDGPPQREFLLLVHALNDETAAAEEIVSRYGTAAEEKSAADF